METPDLVEVEIESIRKSMLTEHRVVMLRAKGGGWMLPIWIGPFEAEAIALVIQGHQPHRPMTHDLSLRLIAPLGGQVRRVVVNRIAEQTFYAEIMLEVGDQTHLIDARPSDAIALAVRTNAPIFVARAVLETAGAASEDEWMQREAPEVIGAGPFLRKDPIEQTWALVLTAGLGTAQQRSISLQEFTSAEWPSRADSRDIEWEGRNMLAVALPGSAERETWLIVKPNFWEQFTTVTIEPVTSPQPNPPPEGE